MAKESSPEEFDVHAVISYSAVGHADALPNWLEGRKRYRVALQPWWIPRGTVLRYSEFRSFVRSGRVSRDKQRLSYRLAGEVVVFAWTRWGARRKARRFASAEVKARNPETLVLHPGHPANGKSASTITSVLAGVRDGANRGR